MATALEKRFKAETPDREVAGFICSRIAKGDKGLRRLIEELKAEGVSVPGLDVFLAWLRNDDDCNELYARAKSQQADMLGEDILDIIDSDELEAHDKRIRVDGRKWLMSKMKPRVYGDKLDVTSAGEALQAAPLNPMVADQRLLSLMQLAAQRAAAEREAQDLLG